MPSPYLFDFKLRGDWVRVKRDMWEGIGGDKGEIMFLHSAKDFIR